MIFELMSRGDLARLPDDMLLPGLTNVPAPRVILLLPYNRYILGTVDMRAYERWALGKIGSEDFPEEIFLYEEKPKTINLGEVGSITVSRESIDLLKSCLRRQMPPPGEHQPAMLILRGLLKDDSRIVDDAIEDEGPALELLEKDGTLRAAYWAMRFALSRNDYDAVSRTKTWIRTASDVFEGAAPSPRIWFSLTDLPGRKDIEEIEGLGYTVDDLQRMNSQSSRPVVLYSKSGYLVLSDYGGDSAGYRIWLYLPIPLWNEMREKRKLSIRELVMATWGYLDGMAADAERSSFGQRTLAPEKNALG